MPANLSPDYLAAEQRFKAARTPQEKVEALEEMLATIPKHKGTEKMQADLKRRLSKVRSEAQKKSGTAHALPFYHIDKEGAGQVVLVGPPNSGKSLLLSRLTKAEPEVADYPFTTRMPFPGMMQFEDIQFQLIDLPAVSEEYMESWVPTLVRQADAAALVVDLGADDLLEEVENTRAILEKSKVELAKPGEWQAADHAVAPAQGPQQAPEPPVRLAPGVVVKTTLLVGNKLDRPGARDNLAVLCDLLGVRYPLVVVSAESGEGLHAFRRAIFDLLGLVRVYTKAPGRKFERTAPYVLKRGATALNAAEHVHKDFAAQLKFARVWGHGKFEGQMVQRDYPIADGDIIEFHI